MNQGAAPLAGQATTLHLTNAYHPASGGIRTFYREMLAAAEREGRRMRLVVPGPRDEVEDVGRFGRVYHVRAPRSPIVDRRYRLMLPHTFLRRDGPLARILRVEQPDLVEVCDKYALCYLAGLLRRGRLAGVARPTLVGLSCERAADNLGAWLPARWRARLARWYLGRVYAGQFDVHLANSEYTADELRGSMHHRHRREVHVVPMGVALDGFGPERRSPALRADLARRLSIAEPFHLVLYAGRLAREKNLPLLVDTIARHRGLARRPAALVVAGSGPLESPLAAIAASGRLGPALLLGQVSDRGALAALYATADAFVHPNPREPFGIAPLEAMASGVPLVAPRAGGLLTYASDANAWLAEPAAPAMAAALTDALAPTPLRARRLANARARAAAFDWPAVCRDVFAVYDALHRSRLGRSA
jgi:alpha-1,6-mannosyltransferase